MKMEIALWKLSVVGEPVPLVAISVWKEVISLIGGIRSYIETAGPRVSPIPSTDFSVTLHLRFLLRLLGSPKRSPERAYQVRSRNTLYLTRVVAIECRRSIDLACSSLLPPPGAARLC
jgi:hypothetical protein